MSDNNTSIIRLALWLSFWAFVVFVLGSCATTRPQPADVPVLSVHQDSLRRDSLAGLPPYLVPPPAGSTPRQKRQWQNAQRQNLARAGHAPASVKVKNSTVAAGAHSTAVSTAKNSSTAAGTGATSVRIEKPKAPTAVGPAAAATDARVTQRPFPWWLLAIAGGLLVVNRLVRGRWLL